MNLDKNKTTAFKAALVVVFMGSLAWASVPFYDWFCRTTGFGGVTQISTQASDVVLDQTIVVRFDASLEKHMPWQFKPVQQTMELRIGETALAFYQAHNPTDRPVAGTSTFNVVPYAAGAHFNKLECFCFEQQVLQPGETVQMPVSFYVDPAILTDPEAQSIEEITLSYTFYEIELGTDD